MPDRVPTCPRCGAPVTASRFARVATCAFCQATVHLDDGVLSVARFREAYQAWHAPTADDGAQRFTVSGDTWVARGLLAHGEISDVYEVDRARRPSEHALLHHLRDAVDAPLFDQAWQSLCALSESTAPGSQVISKRLPQPVARDARHLLFRFAPGFVHTFDDVRAAHPQGVDPTIALWMWRRVLELLAFIHKSGFVHGAVLPPHLIVERGEHGVRLVGFGCAAPVGRPLLAICTAHRALYPPELLRSHRPTPAHDVQMSAACVSHLLGGNAPARLSALLSAVRDGSDSRDAWTLREALGPLAKELFGPPSFHPLVMP